MEKEFSFGFGQTKIIIDNSKIIYKEPGRKKSYIPLDSVDSVLYESEMLYGYISFIGSGTKLDRVRVPKKNKSMDVSIQIDEYIKLLKN